MAAGANDYSPYLVYPRDLIAGIGTGDVGDIAATILDIGLADSMLQAEYLAAIFGMNHLSFDEMHVFMLVGRWAGPNLDPVDLNDSDFVAALCSQRALALHVIPTVGSA